MPSAVVVKNKSYPKLLNRIRTEIDSGRRKIEHTRALTYWNVGKIINEDILRNAKRAGYGEQLCARLGRDLNIGERTIQRSIQFHREYPIPSPATELSWAHYTELLAVSNMIQRRQLQKRAVTEGLSRDKLREEIVESQRSNRGQVLHSTSAISSKHQSPVTRVPRLVSQKGALNIYQTISSDLIKPRRGEVLIDCGFNAWKVIKRKDFKVGRLVKARAGMSFTYQARIEAVIDGDTVWAVIAIGFNDYTRQKLRLRGIDTPEIKTAAGKRAKRFVEKALSGLEYIVIKSSKSDKYDRYLADIFYGEGEKFLNQELLDNGLATVWKD